MSKKDLSDEDYWQLYKAFCKGNQRASRELESKLGKRLYNYIRRIRIYTCEEDIWDCMQHTWLKLVKNCSNSFDKVNFWSIASTIAKCKAFDDWDRKKTVKRNLGNPVLPDDQDNEWENIVDPCAKTPEELAMIEQFIESLELLPEKQRKALILQLEGYSIAEIASLMDEKQETVKSHIRYAKDKLKNILSPEAESRDSH
jgi:RNA polymerase sigma factor (sigma-70 family)